MGKMGIVMMMMILRMVQMVMMTLVIILRMSLSRWIPKMPSQMDVALWCYKWDG